MTNEHISLISSCTSGGCGAKLPPGELDKLLSALPVFTDPRLLVGFGSSDDAAVYDLDGENSLVLTADFFSPMVDDPYVFGKIAAANALSDVYAMGGRPLMALNLVCFPEALPVSILAEIMRGGAEKLMEAGCALAGGHSIYDKEPKYGLAVTGIVPTKKILKNDSPKAGHTLILTKPLGVGIVMAANRAGLAEEASMAAALASMERLNRYAGEKLAGFDVSACTDVTGFGLAVHGMEMAGNGVSLVINPWLLPTLPGALGLAEEYIITAAGQRNRLHAGNKADVDHLPFGLQELVFDPQTSGGLLIAVEASQAEALLTAIQKDDPAAAVIGHVAPRMEAPIVFTNQE